MSTPVAGRARRSHVLVHVEDPGAANYIAEIPASLRARGIVTVLVASGPAVPYLQRRGIPLTPLDSHNVGRLVDDVDPTLILVGTAEDPDAVGLRFVDEGRRRGLLTVAAIDAPMNADYRFRGRATDPLRYAPDWLLVPDEYTAVTYRNLGFCASRILLVGHPHYDFVRSYRVHNDVDGRRRRRRHLFPRSGDKCVIVFATEPGNYRRTPEYTLTGRGAAHDRTAIVLEEFLDAINSLSHRPFIVLRLHPKDSEAKYRSYLTEVDQVSKEESALELLTGTDVVVGLTTMLLVEAVILGRPTLSIVPRPSERRWLPTTALGLTSSVSTRKELRRAIAELANRALAPRQSLVDDNLPSGALAAAAEAICGLLPPA